MFKIVQCRLRDILLQFQGHRFLKTVVFIFCRRRMCEIDVWGSIVWFETPAVVKLEAGNEFIKYKNIYIYIQLNFKVFEFTAYYVNFPSI